MATFTSFEFLNQIHIFYFSFTNVPLRIKFSNFIIFHIFSKTSRVVQFVVFQVLSTYLLFQSLRSHNILQNHFLRANVHIIMIHIKFYFLSPTDYLHHIYSEYLGTYKFTTSASFPLDRKFTSNLHLANYIDINSRMGCFSHSSQFSVIVVKRHCLLFERRCSY